MAAADKSVIDAFDLAADEEKTINMTVPEGEIWYIGSFHFDSAPERSFEGRVDAVHPAGVQLIYSSVNDTYSASGTFGDYVPGGMEVVIKGRDKSGSGNNLRFFVNIRRIV